MTLCVKLTFTCQLGNNKVRKVSMYIPDYISSYHKRQSSKLETFVPGHLVI